jgi:hypothetical protein
MPHMQKNDAKIKVVPFGKAINEEDLIKLQEFGKTTTEGFFKSRAMPKMQDEPSPFASYSDPMAAKPHKYTVSESRPVTRGNAGGTAPGGTRGGRRTRGNPNPSSDAGLNGIYPTAHSS